MCKTPLLRLVVHQVSRNAYVTFIDLCSMYSTSATNSLSFVTPRLSRTLSKVASAIWVTHTRAADEKCILHYDMPRYLFS